MPVRELYSRIREQMGKAIFGQEETIDLALAALFSGGHVLLEGVPGVAKTMLVRTLSSTISMQYRRIQMTPDLLPGDITGSSVYREDSGSFQFVPGPIFTNFLLADELNRAGARTQSALLEAMQEGHITYGGETHHLPDPFVVFATQNPIDQEGTYPLPMAQLDRFMFKIIMGYPSAEHEEQILHSHKFTGRQTLDQIEINAVVSPDEIKQARALIQETQVRDEVVSYVRRLVQFTREDDNLQAGASPRAGLMMLVSAKSIARFDGRDFVTPDDIKRIFLPALRHRILLSPNAEMEGITADDALANALEIIDVPR